MMNRMPNPFGHGFERIKKESKRFQGGDVDSPARIARESERFRQSDVDTTATDVMKGKKPRAVRDWERNGQGG